MITALQPQKLTEQELHRLSPQSFDLANIFDEDRNAFAAPGGCFLVVKDEGHDAYAACAGFRQTGPKVCEIQHFVVTFAYRGRGLGGALMKRLIQEARAAGYTTITSQIEPWCPEWRAFYAANGFKFLNEAEKENMTGSAVVQLELP